MLCPKPEGVESDPGSACLPFPGGDLSLELPGSLYCFLLWGVSYRPSPLLCAQPASQRLLLLPLLTPDPLTAQGFCLIFSRTEVFV